MLEELLILRKNVLDNKKLLSELSDEYYKKLANAKNGINSTINNDFTESEMNRLNKIGRVSAIISCILALLACTGVIPLFIPILYFILSPLIGTAIIIPSVRKRIKQEKSVDDGSNCNLGELYERVTEFRVRYHEERKKLESKLNNLSIENNELYQEYLNMVSEYVDTINEACEEKLSEESTRECEEQNKKLNL